MAVSTNTAVIDMSGTTEVPVITVSAAACATLIHGLTVNMAAPSVNATVKLYQNYVEMTGASLMPCTAGRFESIANAVAPIAITSQAVLKMTPAGGGGTGVSIPVAAVTEDLPSGVLGTAAESADAVLDELLSAHTAAGSLGERLANIKNTQGA